MCPRNAVLKLHPLVYSTELLPNPFSNSNLLFSRDFRNPSSRSLWQSSVFFSHCAFHSTLTWPYQSETSRRAAYNRAGAAVHSAPLKERLYISTITIITKTPPQVRGAAALSRFIYRLWQWSEAWVDGADHTGPSALLAPLILLHAMPPEDRQPRTGQGCGLKRWRPEIPAVGRPREHRILVNMCFAWGF